MNSLITAGARALAAGDPLGALKRVALRGDAPAFLAGRKPRRTSPDRYRAAGTWRTKTGSGRERAILSALITSRNVLSFCDGGPRTTFPPFAKRWV